MVLTFDLKNRVHVYLAICIAYTFAFGLSLFNSGIYWDDWVLYNQSPSSVIEMFTQALGAAGYIVAYIHLGLLSLPGSVFFYRLLTFIFFLFAGIFLYRILHDIPEIDYKDRFFIVLLFLLLPFNSARTALICFIYSFCYFSFFFAFFLFVKYRANRFARISSLLLFSFSFFTNSIVFFYMVFLLFILYKKEREKAYSLVSILNTVRSHLDYFIAPIIFWIIKSLFFRASALYADYNIVTVSTLFGLPYDIMIKVLGASLLDLLNMSFIKAAHVLLILFLMLLSSAISTGESALKSPKNGSQFILFGLFSLAVAVFPYIAVGKEPSFADWSSRYQLLMPLGASFFLYYGMKKALAYFSIHENIFIAIISIFIITLVAANVKIQVSYAKDWYKQLSMIANFKENTIIKENTTFLFYDNIQHYNANNRTYRFYEYTGLMKYAFRGETRFGILADDFKQYKSIANMQRTFTALYNMKDYKPKDFDYAVSINDGGFPLSSRNSLKLIYYERLQPAKFNDRIKRVLKMELIKI